MTRDERGASADQGWPVWHTITLVGMALLGTVVLIALILTLGSANRQRDAALRRQVHSYDVMILARTLSGTIARAEATLGRYVISGDRQLGQLYVDDWQQAGGELDRLDQITHDNHEQQLRIDRLRTAYVTRGNELSLIALSTNYKLNRQALARYYQARQAPSLTEIDAQLDQIIDRERSLLDDRTTAAMGSVDRSSEIAGVLAVFGILIVLGAIWLGWMTVKAIGERAVAEADAGAAEERAIELAVAVAQATDELRAQESKLRQAQKMDAVGQLTGGIAHDFNNMLAVVLGGLELAGRSLGDAVIARRHIDSAREGADRAAALTRRLLAFSREESLKPEPLPVSALVAGMSELLDRTLGDAITVTVATDGFSENWLVCADRLQLENAILNLAVNARDAMSGRGRLAITVAGATLAEGDVGTCAAGDHVTIAVADSGEGMAPGIIERVFEPFFTTKPAGQGTGLGLSQIFALVRQLNGDVAIVSTPGSGTTVTLFIPREPDVAHVAQANVVPDDIPTPSSIEGLRVLLVEDDPRVLAATSEALAELGHQVVPCENPFAAAGLLQQHPIDLILSDVLMPRCTGPEMIAALGDAIAGIPVLYVTGFAGDVSAVDFSHHGILRKPFTLVALERAIEAAMTGGGALSRQLAAE